MTDPVFEDRTAILHALYEVGPQFWSCGVCSPHKGSRPNWCDAGCGSDYNRMVPLWELDAIVAMVAGLGNPSGRGNAP